MPFISEIAVPILSLPTHSKRDIQRSAAECCALWVLRGGFSGCRGVVSPGAAGWFLQVLRFSPVGKVDKGDGRGGGG